MDVVVGLGFFMYHIKSRVRLMVVVVLCQIESRESVVFCMFLHSF